MTKEHLGYGMDTGQPGLTEEQRERIALAYYRLDHWKRRCMEFYERAKESRKIMLLQDPKQDRVGASAKTIQLQTLKSTINNCIADQMDNLPEARLLPERPELGRVAEDFTDVVNYVLSQNRYEGFHYARIWDYFVTGTTITQVAWDPDMDYGEGNVSVIRWPVDAFVWDPAAADIQDARALMKVSWHPRSWYDERFPDEAKYIAESDASNRDVGLPDAQEDADADDDAVMLVEYWYRKYNPKTRRHTVGVDYLAGGALLGSEEDVYRHGMYPFVFTAFTPIEGLPVGDGLVQELVPMMRYINRYAQYMDENIAMSSKIRMLVKKDSGIDSEALADWSQNIITGDRVSENDIRWLQSRPLSGLAYQQMLQMQTDLKQDSGQNQFTRGETAGGITAASAISALQEAGGKITRMNTSKLNFGFKQIVEQIMWLVSQFYDDRRVKMITGSDGKQRKVDMSSAHLMGMDEMPEEMQAALVRKAQEQGLSADEVEAVRAMYRRDRGKRMKEALPPPPYTVQIQIQRRNPLRVQAQNDLFIQAYTMAAQAGQVFPLTLLFELLNVDGKERIMPVLQSVDQQTQMLKQMQQGIQQLQQENETLKKAVADYGKSIRGTQGQSGTDRNALAQNTIDPNAQAIQPV